MSCRKSARMAVQRLHIRPLAGLRVRGFAWYQGESNVDNAAQYGTLLTTMIGDWRRAVGISPRPRSLWCRSPRATRPPTNRCTVRQPTCARPRRLGLDATENRADRFARHPCQGLASRQQRPVGDRLALAALNLAHGRGEVIYQGPTLASHEVRGDTIVLRLSSTQRVD